jgi:periplasmic copper chaperone A
MATTTRLGLLLTGLPCLFLAFGAKAHIELESGPAAANATSDVVFAVGHGCSGNDTYRLKIDIPAGVTSVRPMRSDFGRPAIAKDAAGTVTSITWQKPDSEALDSDLAFYTVVVRLKTPDQPFTTLYFAAHQTCRAGDGTLTTVEWTDVPTTPAGSATGNPAVAVQVVPARLPGWNKYTIPAAMTDLGVFFKDAQIVWKGSAAYSANPNTATLISSTSGVTALTALSSGDQVWVKY